MRFTEVLHRCRLVIAGLLCLHSANTLATCPYGEDQCLPGFVWRNAFPGDHVCVSGDVRDRTAMQNAQADANRQPGGGPSGPNTCRFGFVWREAEPDDQVCVTGADRAQAAADNALALTRRDPVCPEPVSSESLGLLTLNLAGTGDVNGISAETRARRIALWVRRHHLVPDVIVIQESYGWLYTPPVRDCGRGFARGSGDYDQIDVLLKELSDQIGLVYRVAYLTGRTGGFGTIQCGVYHAQSMLYNPGRLVNLTQTLTGSVAHDSEDPALRGTPHLRRSLPLCNRGTMLMPLGTLIDGPSQFDKCGRATPSGPAQAVFDTAHISGSHVRFAFVVATDKVIELFDMHPTAGLETQEKVGLDKLIASQAPVSADASMLFPPILTGDFNSMAESMEPNFPDFLQLAKTPTNVLGTMIGRLDRFAARYRMRAAQTLYLPDEPDGAPCDDPRYLISDHCGVFVRLDQDGADAGALRGIFINGPTEVNTGEPYSLQAVASGGGPSYTYRWLPNGATSSTVNASAGSAGTSLTWLVEVTDSVAHRTVTQQHTVAFNAPPRPPNCQDACRSERDGCIQEAHHPGRPNLVQCVREYLGCRGTCRP